MSASAPSYLHPLERGDSALPDAFTFPFRYTPHPLCIQAAAIVQTHLQGMGVDEGKMYGVIVVEVASDAMPSAPSTSKAGLAFMAAYSGQLFGSYDHPWFVPPVVDYLDPESHFQKEQASISELNAHFEALRTDAEIQRVKALLAQLRSEREAAIAEAKQTYAEGKARREQLRSALEQHLPSASENKQLHEAIIRESQHQKADIQRAKQLHKEEIVAAEELLAAHNGQLRNLSEERKRRSEALQQWLFDQFNFLNGRGERRSLHDLFPARRIPSGAGECCAPKLLQAAYVLGLRPVAMAEFWWGPSSPDHYHQPGAFFPACHSKCRPILTHMLEGLNVEPDPAEHYDKVNSPIRVAWEDKHLAVIEKPAGWVSIPGKSDQASVFDAAHRLWPDIEGSVIVHRLDMDTSGLMVVAKDATTHRALSLQFERREVSKRYIALLEGRINTSGTINIPIAPDLEQLPRRMTDPAHGKEAITDYVVLSHEERDGKPVTRIAFFPRTGRTHQLRVHSASPDGLGHPIVGDRLYGHVGDRLCLHAEALSLRHPVTGEQLHFELPAPF